MGKIHEFTCLPFGLNVAPYLFMKIMKPVITFLRKRGFFSVIYLDDLLLIGNSYEQCSENLNFTIMCFEQLGFLINYDKSHLLPLTHCQYLGLINTKDMLLELPESKRMNIRDLVRKLEKLQNCKIRDFASFVGSLGDCCKAALYGWAHMKDFEREKIKALSDNNGSFKQEWKLKLIYKMTFCG